MASKSIRGIVIEIDGNTDGLAKSLKDVNGRIGDINSALAKVNKALKLDPKNVEALKQKQDLLAQSIEATKKKLDLEKEAAEKAKEALALGQITKGEYDNLQAEVQLTTSKLNDLEKEANETEKDLQDLGEGAQKSGDKAKKAGDGFEAFGDAAKVAAEAAAAAFAAALAAITAATAALATCTVEAAEYADNMLTLSSVTGMSTDTLQQYSYASELLDVSLETVSGALKKNTKAMSSAAEGSGAAYEAYNQLGVSVTDASGQLRDSEAVFWDAIDALGQVQNETERDALAMEIFGKSATDLNPLIEAGSDTFKQYADEAEKAGAVLDGDTLDAFAEFDDTLARLDASTGAAKNALGTVLLPVLDGLAGEGVDLLQQFTNGVLAADGDMSKVGDLIAELIPQAIDAIMEQLPVALELGASVLGALAEGLVSNLDLILTTAVDILVTLATGILGELPTIAATAVNIVMTLLETLVTPANIQMIAQTAVDILLTLVNGISENISEIISTAIMLINTIQTTLISNAPELLLAAIELIMALAFGILDNLDDIVEAGINIVVALVNAVCESAPTLLVDATNIVMEQFTNMGDGLVKDALTWGADFIASLIDGIMNAVPDLTNAVGDIASTIDSYLGFSCPDVGALADFDKSGGDMVDLFASSMKKQLPTLQSAVNSVAATVAGASPATDYTGQLNKISGQLAGGSNIQIVTPVYIGGELITNELNTITAQQTYRNGGFN